MYILVSSLVLLMASPVYLGCADIKTNPNIPSAKEVLENVLAGHEFKDLCIGGQSIDSCFWTSHMRVEKPDYKKQYKFRHDHSNLHGHFMYTIFGRFSIGPPSTNYIKFEGTVWGPDNMKKRDISYGKIYILDVVGDIMKTNDTYNGEYSPGSVVTYYSCFDNGYNVRENIYISGNDFYDRKMQITIKNMEKAKERLKNLKIDIPDRLKQLSCFYPERDRTWDIIKYSDGSEKWILRNAPSYC